MSYKTLLERKAELNHDPYSGVPEYYDLMDDALDSLQLSEAENASLRDLLQRADNYLRDTERGLHCNPRIVREAINRVLHGKENHSD